MNPYLIPAAYYFSAVIMTAYIAREWLRLRRERGAHDCIEIVVHIVCGLSIGTAYVMAGGHVA